MENIISVKYLEELGSSKATPGGGSACCNVGILACSLVLKSLNITKSRKSFETKEEPIKELIKNSIAYFEKVKKELEVLEDKDLESFTKFMEAYKEKNNRKIKNCLIKSFESAYAIYNKFLEASNNGNELLLNIVDSIKADYYFGMNLFYECMENALNNMKENAKLLNSKKYTDIIQQCEGLKNDISIKRKYLRVVL